ncbi:MAG: hypothetical protein WCK89_19765, partial [bacterium]
MNRFYYVGGCENSQSDFQHFYDGLESPCGVTTNTRKIFEPPFVAPQGYAWFLDGACCENNRRHIRAFAKSVAAMRIKGGTDERL